jgi:hypothetical protein
MKFVTLTSKVSLISRAALAGLGLALILSSTVDLAEAARHDRRQNAQRARIRDGVKDGSMTRGEASRARAGQRKIRRMERRFEKDGVVTDKEKAKLEKEQDKQSRKIMRMKNNDKVRNENAAQPANPAVPGDGTNPTIPAQPAVPSQNAAPETAPAANE